MKDDQSIVAIQWEHDVDTAARDVIDFDDYLSELQQCICILHLISM